MILQSLCKVNKEIAWMLLRMHLRVRVPSLCTCQVHLFKCSHAHAPQITWKDPPRCELLSQRKLWCLKMEMGVFERKAYRCISATGGGGKRHAWCRVLSWLRDVITWRYSSLLMHTVTHTQTNSGEPQRSTSWPPNLWFGWDESLPQHHTETDGNW